MLPPKMMLHTRLAECLFFVMGLLAVAALGVRDRTALLAQERTPAKADRNGDPLPTGALARLGTVRWRHAEAVTFVVFLPDGKAVLTGGLDRTLRLWDRQSGKELRRFTLPAAKAPAQGAMQAGALVILGGQGRGNPAPALSPDGTVVAAAVPGNKIQLWDVATGNELRTLPGPRPGMAGFAFAPGGKSMAVRGADRAIYLIDAATGKELRRIQRDKQPRGVFAIVLGGQRLGDTGRLAFRPDGKTLATSETGVDANNQGTAFIRIIDVETGNDVRRIDLQPPTEATAIAYSSDGKVLAYASGNTLHLCQSGSGEEVRAIKMPTGAAALVFAPDSRTLAVSGTDRAIRLWDPATGKEVHRLGQDQPGADGKPGAIRFSSSDVRALTFAPDGKTLAIGDGNTVRFFDSATGAEQPPAAGHGGPVSAVRISADGKTLVSRGSDRTIRCWDPSDGRQISVFPEPAGTASVSMSPDGKTIACAGNDGLIRLHEVATGIAVRQFKAHANGTAFVAFAPNGKTLASAGAADNTVRLYDASTGSVLRQMAIRPDGAAKADGPVVAIGFGARVHLAFSADGRMLVGEFNGVQGQLIGVGGGVQGFPAGTVLRLWDVATGKEIRKFALPPQHGAGSVAVSRDGRVVATENTNGTVSLWETASGRERLQLGEPQKAPPAGPAMMGANFFQVVGVPVRTGATTSTLAFSPDGTLLTGNGPEHSVRIWDAAAGKAIGQFKGHGGAVSAIAFAPDGKRLATGSRDTTILLWDTAGLRREPPPASEPHADELAGHWAVLADDNAAKAFQSIRRLTAHPQTAVPFLRSQLKPVVPADPKKLAKLVADLDSDHFTTRDAANQELARLGELALPALEKIMASSTTLETRRRAEALLARLAGGVLTPEQLRLVRAVEVLEATATPEARQVLESLASGAPGALATREAQAALDRLKHASR